MEIYRLVELKNGDIELKRHTIDQTKYHTIDRENGNKLLKKILRVGVHTIDELKKFNFFKSTIDRCTVNNQELDRLKYKSILSDIYNMVGCGAKIIKNSVLNIMTIKKEDSGFYYLDNLGISIQGADSNKCLLEIMHQCIKNNFNLMIAIELSDGGFVDINI